MHVLVITSTYPHAGSPTEGLFNEQHALALTRAGIEETVIVCKPWLPRPFARVWNPYRSLAYLPQHEERNGIRVRYVRYLHVPKYQGVFFTVRSCARSALSVIHRLNMEPPFDIIQVHGSYPAGLAAPIIAKALLKPFVVTLHIHEDPRLYRGRTGARLYTRMIEQSSAVVTVGKPLEKILRHKGPEFYPKPLRTIPNGVELDAIDKAMEAVSSPSGEWGNLISVCNLWPVKGIDFNLRALAHLSRRGFPWKRYTIVGDGPQRRPLEKLAKDLGIAKRVDFKGRLSHGEALKEIAKADIFSLPSWQEAFGIVYLEAMACGKAVIGCRGQGAEDIVHHDVNGLLVEPKEVTSLSAAIGHLLGNREFAGRLGKAAREQARQFSWEQNAAKYLDIYQNVGSGGPREGTRDDCSRHG